MQGKSTVIRIKRKLFFFVLFILILAIATPVLADYLGPNRTVTGTTSVCKVVLYECKYIAAKNQWKYKKVDDWSCSNEGKPWQGVDNYDGECGPFSDGRTQWGQVESIQTVTTTHPEATIVSALQGCTLSNGWCNTASELSLNGIEPLSGYNILAVEGSLNGQTFACSGDNCSVPLNEGNNDFSFWAISSWGDSSQMGTFSAQVDTVLPTLGLDITSVSGSNGWYVSPTSLTATGSDSTSGLSSVFLSVDNGGWQPSTKLNEGVYNVLVQAEDNAGNIAQSSTAISVDTTTPTIAVSVNGTTGSNGWYSSGMQVSATATDATSGVASLESSLDGGIYQAYTSPVSFADGYHTVQFKAVDTAGNETETSVQGFYVDTIIPAIDLPAEWEVNDTITYKVQDDGSGLSALRVVIEDEDEKFAKVAWNETVSGNKFKGEIIWNGKFKDGTIAPPGEYLVWVKVTDTAGNERIGLGRVIVPSLFSLFSPSQSSTAIPTPPRDLFDSDNSSPTTENSNANPSTSPSTSFGGATSPSNSTSLQSLTLTSGSSSASATTPSNVLWGATAAALIGWATATALEEQKKRKEREQAQAAQVQAQVDAFNAAQSAKRIAQMQQWKINSWLEGQAILDGYIEAAIKQGASETEIAELKRTGAMHGFGVAIENADNTVQTLAVQNETRQRALEQYSAGEREYVPIPQPPKQDLQAGLAAYYAAMRQGEKEAQTNWWEKTKSFVNEKIVKPANSYIYQPIIKPVSKTITEVFTNSTTWVNEHIYHPYVKPEIDRGIKNVTAGISWANENIYQPYVQPELDRGIKNISAGVSWINENIYQPYVKPEIDRGVKNITAGVSWVNDHIYQPYIKPTIERAVKKLTSGVAWVNDHIYQPFIQPKVDKLMAPIATGLSWVNQNIYQPIFQPVVNDINKYIYQPLADSVKKAWDKYGEWVHGTLDVAGLIPGLGEIADGFNGLIYLGEGRYVEAAISAAAMIPILGDLGKAGKWTIKIGSEVVEVVAETTVKTALKEIAENASQEVVEKVVKETLEEGLEKTAKEALENVAEKAAENTLEQSAKEMAQISLANTIKESGQQIQIDTIKEAAERSIKEFVETQADYVAKEAAQDYVEKATKNITNKESKAVVEYLQVAALRTNTGAVDQVALTKLLDELPEVKLANVGDENNLEQFVAKSLNLDTDVIGFTRVAGEGAKGVSGAPVFIITNQAGEGIGIAKLFPDTDGFARELSALQRLDAEELNLVGSPDVLGIGKSVTPSGEGGILITSLAPGKGLDDYMIDVVDLSGQARIDALNDLKTAIAKNAEALAELHTKPIGSGGVVAPEYLEQHIKAINEITSKIQSNSILSDFPDIHQLSNQLDTKVNELINGLRQNPGGSALAHGDAHPGNFFYDPQKGITLIDTPSLHSSMDALGNPIGTPARDFANFDQKLAHFGKQFDFGDDEIAELQTIFRQSYELANGAMLTDEAVSFFRARTALGELIKAINKVGADMSVGSSVIEEIVKPQLELVMKVLGLGV